MLKDISKKLTMKKSFFVTQLEGFFNAITQEYQELIHQKEVENSLLEEKIRKLEKDVENLVAIRHRLNETVASLKAQCTHLEERLETQRAQSDDERYRKLLEENRNLKTQLRKYEESDIETLRAQVEKLKNALQKGAGTYQENLASQQTEAMIEAISKTLKKSKKQ